MPHANRVSPVARAAVQQLACGILWMATGFLPGNFVGAARQDPVEVDQLARFRAETPKAWQRYAEFIDTLQGSSLATTVFTAKDRESTSLQSKFKQATGSVWWWKKWTLANGSDPWSIECANPKYAFSLTAGSENFWRITKLSFALQSEPQLAALRERMRRALAPNFYLSGIALTNLQKFPAFNMLSVTPDPAPGQEQALKVAYGPPASKEGSAAVRKGTFRVDPAHDWVILDYASENGGIKTAGQFEYDFTAKMPILTWHTVGTQGPANGPKSVALIDRKETVGFELTSETSPDAKEFTLSAHGLPELTEAEWEQQQAVVELLEDDITLYIDNLNNVGANDGSIAFQTEQSHFSGKSALVVTPFQRFQAAMPFWRYQIAAEPRLGQYRYLRFAWKRTVAPGIMLQLFAQPNTWHRYYAGEVSEKTKAWGAMTRIADEPPRQWQMVTRDLFEDFGPMTVTGISFAPMAGLGQGLYDHIYLGRTIADLDRITALHKNVLEGPMQAEAGPLPNVSAPAAKQTTPLASGKFWPIVVVGILILTLIVVLIWQGRTAKE